MLNIKKVSTLPTETDANDTLYLSTEEKKIRLDSAGVSTEFVTGGGSSGGDSSGSVIQYSNDRVILAQYRTPVVSDMDVSYIGLIDDKFYFYSIETNTDSSSVSTMSVIIYSCSSSLLYPQFSDMSQVVKVDNLSINCASRYDRAAKYDSACSFIIYGGNIHGLLVAQCAVIDTANNEAITERQSYKLFKYEPNSNTTTVIIQSQDSYVVSSGTVPTSLLAWRLRGSNWSSSNWSSQSLVIPSALKLMYTLTNNYIIWADTYCKALDENYSIVTLDLDIAADGSNSKGNRTDRSATLITARYLLYNDADYAGGGSYNDHDSRWVVRDLIDENNFKLNTAPAIMCKFYAYRKDGGTPKITFMYTEDAMTVCAYHTEYQTSKTYLSMFTDLPSHAYSKQYFNNTIPSYLSSNCLQIYGHGGNYSQDYSVIYTASLSNINSSTNVSPLSDCLVQLWKNADCIASVTVSGYVYGCRLELIKNAVTTAPERINICIDRGNQYESVYTLVIDDDIKPDLIYGLCTVGLENSSSGATSPYPYGMAGYTYNIPIIFNKYIKPCVLRNGVVQYYLKPDDFTKKADGSTASISSANGDDVMIEIPRIGYRWPTTDSFELTFLKDIPGFSYVPFLKNDGSLADKIYIGAYLGSQVGSSLRSLSGQSPNLSGLSLDQVTTIAQSRSGYGLMSFYHLCLLQMLYILYNKSAFSSWQSATAVINTGGTETSGMFYGSTTTSGHIKICGMEDLFGNCSCYIDGIRPTADRGVEVKLSGEYIKLGYRSDSDSSYGYINTIAGTTSACFLPTDFRDRANYTAVPGYIHHTTDTSQRAFLIATTSTTTNSPFNLSFQNAPTNFTARLVYIPQ